MTIQPLILGHGRAGEAIAKSWMSLKVMHPELGLGEPRFLARDANLKEERAKCERAILGVAQPPGAHTDSILKAAEAGFDAILCEKPACVTADQIAQLRGVKTPTAIAHVYRQMWGPQTIKKMIDSNMVGEIITIEGRYWQSSTAERALKQELTNSWKNNVALSGAYDTFIDTGTHWLDAASFLVGALPKKIQGWRSYANAEAPHRDSHVQLTLDYPKDKRASVSVSKTVHGAMNHFEINVLGTRASVHWEFMKPDEIFVGEGRDRRVITRKTTDSGSQQGPHHGMGWLEGYIEISHRLLNHVLHAKPVDYPHLQENLDLLDVMLKTQWSE